MRFRPQDFLLWLAALIAPFAAVAGWTLAHWQ